MASESAGGPGDGERLCETGQGLYLVLEGGKDPKSRLIRRGIHELKKVIVPMAFFVFAAPVH